MQHARHLRVLLCVTAGLALCLGVAAFSAADESSAPSASAVTRYGEPTAEDSVSTQADTTKADAMFKALKAGEIREEQTPCTYPAALREVIGLSDEHCAGELGRTLAAQYD